MTARLLPALTLAAIVACAGPRAGSRGAAQRGLDALAANQAPQAALLLGPPGVAGDAAGAFGQALVARRVLDSDGELRALAAALRASPDGPLAPLVLRRLAELAEHGPDLSARVEATVAPVLVSGRLRAVAAYRARATRALAAEARGDHALAAASRAENGAVPAWTLLGPFAEHPHLDFDREVAPERGPVPEEVALPAGLGAQAARTLPAPDGNAVLEGEPQVGDVFALVADAKLATGGRYLVTLSTTLSARLSIDGAPVHTRRAADGWGPSFVHVPVTLAPGAHRLALVVARTSPRASFHVALAREDGAPSDATFAPARPGGAPPPPAAAPAVAGAPVSDARALAAAAAPLLGPVVARVAAARDQLLSDREGAKALLAEARAAAPASALVSWALADAAADDPTLDDRVALGRAEAALRQALSADAGHAAARVRLATLLAGAERQEDAAAELAALDAAAAKRPLALALRARLAADRGLAEEGEALAREALAQGASCFAAEVLAELAGRRGAIAREDEAVATLARCRNGAERAAAHARRRGDPAAEEAALRPLVAARPWAVGPGLARAGALLAGGDAAGAVRAAEALAAVWPRSSEVLKRLAELREHAGDGAGARKAREAALAADPADLALRRGLALEDGGEVLGDVALDGLAAIRAYQAAGGRAGVSSVLVLDASAVEIHPGGAATERVHQVIHVRDQEGVDEQGEAAIPPGAEVLVLRTVKPDGRTFEPERTGAGKGSVSLAGLEPGDFVELAYLRSDRAPRGAGGYAAAPFFFRVTGTHVFRSTYVVRAPAGLGLEVDAHGMEAPAVVREGRFDVVRAALEDVPPLLPEPDAPGATETLPFLSVGTGLGRAALHRGLAEAVAPRARPTLELRALAGEIRAAAGPGASPEALLRAAQARVAREVLGEGGLSEDASEVLSRGRGNRTVVLQAVLQLLGFPARIAMVRSFAMDPAAWRFPPASLYAAPLLRVPAGGKTYWLDPSSRHAPFGAFASSLAGGEALVLPAPGEAPEVARAPDAPLVPERMELSLEVRLAADGSAELVGDQRFSGAAGAALKSTLERVDATGRIQGMEALLGRMFRGVSVSRADFGGLEDPDAPASLTFTARAESVARAAGDRLLVEAALFPARVTARYVRTARRTQPLLVSAPERAFERIVIVPPPGMRVTGTGPRTVESRVGTFTRTERSEGGALVREDRLEVARGRLTPAEYAELEAFAAAVDELQDRPVVVAP